VSRVFICFRPALIHRRQKLERIKFARTKEIQSGRAIDAGSFRFLREQSKKRKSFVKDPRTKRDIIKRSLAFICACARAKELARWPEDYRKSSCFWNCWKRASAPNRSAGEGKRIPARNNVNSLPNAPERVNAIGFTVSEPLTDAARMRPRVEGFRGTEKMIHLDLSRASPRDSRAIRFSFAGRGEGEE